MKESVNQEERNKFSLMIEDMSQKMNISLIEAILHHCEKTGLEVDSIPSLINNTLKIKIEHEAMDLNALKVKTSRLPL